MRHIVTMIWLILALVHHSRFIGGSSRHDVSASTVELHHSAALLNRNMDRQAGRTKRDSFSEELLKKTVFPVTVNLTKFMEAIEKRLNEMNAKIETLGGKIRINSQAIADNKDDIKAVETKCQNTEDNLQGQINAIKDELGYLGKRPKFWLEEGESTWEVGWQKCKDAKGAMVTLENDVRRRAAKETLEKLGYTKPVWISGGCVKCTKVTEDKWKWVSPRIKGKDSKIDLNDDWWLHGGPEDDSGNDATALTLTCKTESECYFINYAPKRWEGKENFAVLCEDFAWSKIPGHDATKTRQ